MDEEVKFKSVYSTWKRSDVAFIKSLLDDNSVVYYIDNEYAAGLAGGGGVSGVMNVMVAENQLDLAKELLKDITKE